jgi:hypothetical protein
MDSPSISTVTPAAEAGQVDVLPERCARSGEWRELCDCVECSRVEQNRTVGAALDQWAAHVGVGLIDSGRLIGREIAPKVVAL